MTHKPPQGIDAPVKPDKWYIRAEKFLADVENIGCTTAWPRDIETLAKLLRRCYADGLCYTGRTSKRKRLPGKAKRRGAKR